MAMTTAMVPCRTYACQQYGRTYADRLRRPGLTVHRLAVREIPRSGKPEELVERFGISAKHVVEAVRLVTTKK
jgi:transketolase